MPKTFKNNTLLPTLAILFTMIMWGMSFISIKIAVTEIPPLTMALLRFIMASVVLLILQRKIEPHAKLDPKDLFKMLIASFFGITIYFFFENTGVQYTTASNASLIIAMVPIMSILADIILFKTKIPPTQILGVIIAIIGTYFVVTANGQLKLDSDAFKGNLLMLGAGLSWVTYIMINKSFGTKYSGLFMTTYQNTLGAILLIPFSLFEIPKWRPFSAFAFLNVLFLALFCSAAGYFLYIYAQNKLDIAASTLYLNLIPVVSVIAGFFLLHESVLPIQLFGGAIIISGILLVNLRLLFAQRVSSRT